MTALLVVAAAGLILAASAFWSLGRPPDLPTGAPPSPKRGERTVPQVIGRVAVAVLAIGLIVGLAWLRP
ncbi:MAG TPA: hypothetical protein VIC62_21695 [Nakamurella sp.]